MQDSTGTALAPTAPLPSAPAGPAGDPWEPVLAFPATNGETYTIDCMGHDVMVAPPIPVERAYWAFGSVTVGVLLGMLSLALTIAGIIALILTRRRRV